MDIKNILTALVHAKYVCDSKLYICPFHLFRHRKHAGNQSLSADKAIFPPHVTFKLNPPAGKSRKVPRAGLSQLFSVSPNRKKTTRNGSSAGVLKARFVKEEVCPSFSISTSIECVEETHGKDFPGI